MLFYFTYVRDYYAHTKLYVLFKKFYFIFIQQVLISYLHYTY